VLGVGGRHVFTVPIKEAGETRDRRNLPHVHHPAPFVKDGALVTYEYGFDICDIADKYFMKTEYEMTNMFHKPENTTDLVKEYSNYHANNVFVNNGSIQFYRYNVICFTSQKITMK